MATLSLSKTWINLATTGSVDFVAAWRDAEESDVKQATGAVRQFAGGRQRGITQVGTASGWTFVLRMVPTVDTDKLALWLGQTVLVRDNRGRRMWGIMLACPRRPLKEQLDLYDVEVTVSGVDVDENV